jgi:hypothetical protein
MECPMKKMMFVPLFLALLLSRAAMAQDHAKSDTGKQENSKTRAASMKAVTLTGLVSDDGKALVSEKDDVWEVSNPNALVGHEGRQVTVKCQMYSEKNEIRVLSLRVSQGEVKYAARLGDSAFRR